MLETVIPNLRALTSFVTFRLARTQNKLNAQASYFLKSLSDLTLVEWRIIQLLRLHEGATMSKLAREVQIDKGQLSRKISKMVDKGLITTEQDDTDHRKQKVHLTVEALTLSDRLMPVMKGRQDMLLAGITESELETFFKVLTVIDTVSERRDLP